jgi:hypothetical protein
MRLLAHTKPRLFALVRAATLLLSFTTVYAVTLGKYNPCSSPGLATRVGLRFICTSAFIMKASMETHYFLEHQSLTAAHWSLKVQAM